MCEENNAPASNSIPITGSSPRVRGKRASLARVPAPIRLIPACAGKTSIAARVCRSRRAHPRVCGENSKISSIASNDRGSSPRVRGKLRDGFVESGMRWLIPACAGKTALSMTNAGQTAAHPRVCGENVSSSARIRAWKGSSPRVRGKQYSGWGFRRGLGLIPACAGKTCRPDYDGMVSRAHPRVCGEN